MLGGNDANGTIGALSCALQLYGEAASVLYYSAAPQQTKKSFNCKKSSLVVCLGFFFF